MKRTRCTEEQIIGVMREYEAGGRRRLVWHARRVFQKLRGITGRPNMGAYSIVKADRMLHHPRRTAQSPQWL